MIAMLRAALCMFANSVLERDECLPRILLKLYKRVYFFILLLIYRMQRCDNDWVTGSDGLGIDVTAQ